ncbi:MAG: hypothetical protein ACYDBP_10150 [Leptospirales bacterium]
MSGNGEKESILTEERIEALFDARGLPAPHPVEIEEWRSQAPSEAVFFERVYSGLKDAALGWALESRGIDLEGMNDEDRSDLLSQFGGEVLDLAPGDLLMHVLEGMARLLVREIEEEDSPILRLTRLTTPPYQDYALAWADYPQKIFPCKDGSAEFERHVLRGVERAFSHLGKKVSRSRLANDLREARRLIREEKRRVRAQEALEKRRERSFRMWVRSLWSERVVRRELGLKPREFSAWVEDGRIPVLLRIETVRDGRMREQILFDPETVRRITPAMIARWRRAAEKNP